MEKILPVDIIASSNIYQINFDKNMPILLPQTGSFELKKCEKNDKVMPSTYFDVKNRTVVHNNNRFNLNETVEGLIRFDVNPKSGFFAVVDSKNLFNGHVNVNGRFLNIQGEQITSVSVFDSNCVSLNCVDTNRRCTIRLISNFMDADTTGTKEFFIDADCLKHMFVESMLLTLYPSRISYEEKSGTYFNFPLKSFELDKSDSKFVSFAVHRKIFAKLKSLLVLTKTNNQSYDNRQAFKLFFVQMKNYAVTEIWKSLPEENEGNFDNLCFGGSKRNPFVLLWDSTQPTVIRQINFKEGWQNVIKINEKIDWSEEEYYSCDEEVFGQNDDLIQPPMNEEIIEQKRDKSDDLVKKSPTNDGKKKASLWMILPPCFLCIATAIFFIYKLWPEKINVFLSFLDKHFSFIREKIKIPARFW